MLKMWSNWIELGKFSQSRYNTYNWKRKWHKHIIIGISVMCLVIRLWPINSIKGQIGLISGVLYSSMEVLKEWDYTLSKMGEYNYWRPRSCIIPHQQPTIHKSQKNRISTVKLRVNVTYNGGDHFLKYQQTTCTRIRIGYNNEPKTNNIQKLDNQWDNPI